MKIFKALELVFEALPRPILQAYVAIAYGRLNLTGALQPAALLLHSVSLLGAGATCSASNGPK